MKEGRYFHKGKAINGEIFLIGGGCESVESHLALEQRSELDKELSYL